MSQQGNVSNNGPLISLLENSPYYFLQYAYVIKEDGYFRLVVIHQGKVLVDKMYATVRGAHIGFSRVFKKRSWQQKVKARWTFFYSPDLEWLEGKAA